MHKHSFLFLLGLISCAFANDRVVPVSASGPTAKAQVLDTVTAHKLYHDGDFEKAIALLEPTLKNGRLRTHGDSVFVFKHLGVMYAANADTRERGKYYMLQLLLIEPTARIMDMYASDMIYMIFKNIQEELATTQAKYANAQKNLAGNSGNPAEPTPSDNPPKPKEASHRSYFWVGATGAAVVIVGVGITAYFLSQDKPATVKTLSVN